MPECGNGNERGRKITSNIRRAITVTVIICKDVLSSFYCVEERRVIMEFLLTREYNVIPESSQRHEIVIMFTFFPTSEPKETPEGYHRSISGQIVPAERPI